MGSHVEVSWNSVLVSLLLLSSPVAAGSFDTREDCDAVLVDFRRNENSKYLYPSDWNKWSDVSAEIGANSAKEICGSYGLLMPSAYHVKDWLSLQEIGRNYSASVSNSKRFPFFLGDKFGTDGMMTDSSGDKVETFILWTQNEPSGDGLNVAVDLSPHSGALYASANDMKDESPAEVKKGMGGKLVCMYPKGSFCFEDSTENLELQKDANLRHPLFLGRVLDSFYLWINLKHRFSNEETIDGDCREPLGEKPPGVKWLSDLTAIEKDEGPVMNELFQEMLPKLGLVPYFTQWGFSSKNVQEMFYWDSSKNAFVKRKHGRKAAQYFSLCVYTFPTDSCPST